MKARVEKSVPNLPVFIQYHLISGTAAQKKKKEATPGTNTNEGMKERRLPASIIRSVRCDSGNARPAIRFSTLPGKRRKDGDAARGNPGSVAAPA